MCKFISQINNLEENPISFPDSPIGLRGLKKDQNEQDESFFLAL